jgi:hypothetical protein
MVATYTTGGKVTCHPPPVSITVLLVTEHGLEGVTESKVEGLGGEVTNDVGVVTTPQGSDTLLSGGTAEALDDTVVAAVETTGLDHLLLLYQTYQHLCLVIPSPAAPHTLAFRRGRQRTWFWMRSLTRSMGAAAVFETAAETPPTAMMLAFVCGM